MHYAGATDHLAKFCETHNIPIVETQAGKSAMAWDHPLNLGPIGVTGGTPANETCAKADVILGVGTRFQDFTTGSWGLFANPNRQLISLNIAAYDAQKHGAMPLLADAAVGLDALGAGLSDYRAPAPKTALKADWFEKVDALCAAPENTNALATDMQVIGAVQRNAQDNTVVMCAAGTMPGELHKLWESQPTRRISHGIWV